MELRVNLGGHGEVDPVAVGTVLAVARPPVMGPYRAEGVNRRVETAVVERVETTEGIFNPVHRWSGKTVG